MCGIVGLKPCKAGEYETRGRRGRATLYTLCNGPIFSQACRQPIEQPQNARDTRLGESARQKYIILFEYFVDHKFWILSPPPFLHKFERARRRSGTYMDGGLTFDRDPPPESRWGPGAKTVFGFHGLVSEFAFGALILFIRMMDKRRENVRVGRRKGRKNNRHE